LNNFQRLLDNKNALLTPSALAKLLSFEALGCRDAKGNCDPSKKCKAPFPAHDRLSSPFLLDLEAPQVPRPHQATGGSAQHNQEAYFLGFVNAELGAVQAARAAGHPEVGIYGVWGSIGMDPRRLMVTVNVERER